MNTEQQIEDALISKLQDLKYQYNQSITNIEALENNFRAKFEELNAVKLTDKEFNRLLKAIIIPDVFQAAHILRETNSFEREDGTPLNYTLVNIKDWCKNTFEVINQLRINTHSSHHRYDVILLINGIPVVQIELKNYGIDSRKAMQQIVDYKNDRGNGYHNTLMCFMQIFIVSNQTDTKYFANNNNNHFMFDANERFLPIYQFADKANQKITGLHPFAEHFLAKCKLGEMISRYMVLVETEQKLMIMRPYQIYAVKAIVESINENAGNGYIWHTTGSGKTLTSFKASTLLKDNLDIVKCLFVVDRKDLDRQTRDEFNRFQKDCVEENTNTAKLVERLLSDNYTDKIIVTTIQKLGLALDSNNRYREQLAPLSDKRIVFIFDECHRSQFGENHEAIKDFFPNAQLFGFTGTPIFDDNATYQQIDNGEQAHLLTTKDVFQKQLHAYTITHAIDDKNVLQFYIEYYKLDNTVSDKKALKKAAIDAILKKHHASTAHRKFNALMATSSINDAIEYYELFKEAQDQKQQEDAEYQRLKIACVFSPPAMGDKDVKQLQEDLPQEQQDNSVDPEHKKKALEIIINDYNDQYDSNNSIGEFDTYYKDVQTRIKEQKYPNEALPQSEKIDITIVVDMLLTGFDAQYLNTLYIDKNLKFHGLIQAFSRTNRVLNDSKPKGNIVDFRQQEDAVNDAIRLFSGEGYQDRAKEIWIVEPAPVVIEKLNKEVAELKSFMASQQLPAEPSEIANLRGNEARAKFINIFKEIQRYTIKLKQYTELDETQQQEIEAIIPKQKLLQYKVAYLDAAKELQALQGKYDEEIPPAVEQLDFEFVLFNSAIIDYDYIMKLVSHYTEEQDPEKKKLRRDELMDFLLSDSKFKNNRDMIKEYINGLPTNTALDIDEVKQGVAKFIANQENRLIAEIATRHGLEIVALQQFTDKVLKRLMFHDDDLSALYTAMQLGWKERTTRKLALMDELSPILKQRAQGREISGLYVYDKNH